MRFTSTFTDERLKVFLDFVKHSESRQQHLVVIGPAADPKWEVPEVVEHFSTARVVFTTRCDLCMYGSATKLPFCIVSSSPQLRRIHERCDKRALPHHHHGAAGPSKELPNVFLEAIISGVINTLRTTVSAVTQIKTGPSQQHGAPRVPFPSFASWRAAERKRPVGQVIEQKENKRWRTGGWAAKAGVQTRRTALPALIQREMEPGQAIQFLTQHIHPFDVDPNFALSSKLPSSS